MKLISISGFYILLTLLMNNGRLFAQNKDTLFIGEVNGVIADTAYHFKLRSASVAVYLLRDSSLYSYQLSNTAGAFHFRGLPLNQPLYLIVSYVGYENKVIRFTVSGPDARADLKTIPLIRVTKELPEVVVKYIPPVRMNRDTLEFNAAAFKLDKNAVVEDLLRKLPGVTVWGDGTITVNGKEISGVKVDGKPFLTGDPKVAIQNIPKDAVDKVQVYKARQNPAVPSDSLSEINVMLKKDKNFGSFGKIGMGSNFSNRYEGDASMSLFNTKSQLGIVWNYNNINKIPRNVNAILRNATYKGISNSLEYSPDFELPGDNRTQSAGLVYQHDFINNPGLYNNNRINGQYFFQDQQIKLTDHSKTIQAVDNKDYQLQSDTTIENTRKQNHSFSSHYNLRKNGKLFDLSTDFGNAVTDRDMSQMSRLSGNSNELLSTNTIISKSRRKSDFVNINLNGEEQIWKNKRNKFPRKVTYNYSVSYEENGFQSKKKSDFISLSNQTENRSFNRSYDNHLRSVDQSFGFGIGNLSPLLFGTGRLSRIETTLFNTLKIAANKASNRVADWDSTLALYSPNPYLTNKTDYLAVTELPTLKFRRTFDMSLANRYFKNLNVFVSLTGTFFFQKNNSDHAFQVFQKGYSDFTPSANISYDNYQLGQHHNIFTLNYARSIGYPMPDQLFPLVDSSNNYYIMLGNPALKRFKKDDVSFTFSHETFSRNVFTYSANISAGLISDFFTDSIIIDNLGRRKQYLVNSNGYRYLSVGGNLKKLLKLQENQFQFFLQLQLNLKNSPNIVNGQQNISYISTKDGALGVYYSLKEILGIELKQSYFNYLSRQEYLQTGPFRSDFLTTSLAATIRFNPRLRICSDIQYKHNSTSFSPPVDYTIWNAHLILRILKNNDLECKMSAMDLLGQNNVIKSSGYNNFITQSISNSLQQYYMLTIAYYPRKFGKKKNDKHHTN